MSPENAPAPVMDDGRGWFRTSDLSRVKRDRKVWAVPALVSCGG